jgi:hypothetical protein
MIRQIVHRFLPAVTRFRKLSAQQWKAVNSIRFCRTPALGGELHACGECDHQTKKWHSCRDRHCPVCQGDAARRWIEKQKEKLLPVSYFHVVFTLPEELNLAFQYNRKLLYDLFFKTGAETLQTLFADPQYLGARGGFLGVLHTWGQLLQFHPHIHWIVPNGGVAPDGRWVRPKRKDGDRFLFPVGAVSELFRGKFLGKLEKLYRKGKLRFPDPLTEANFRDQLNMAAAKRWNIFIKRPFAGPLQVIEYLARYTHRVAIAPSRILEVDDKEVTFRYKDYRDGARQKIATMTGDLFLRRFLEHVLPKGFRKIREYGWMRGEENGPLRARLLARFQKQSQFAKALAKLLSSMTPAPEQNEPSPCRCPQCKEGLLTFVQKLLPEKPLQIAYG